MLAELIVYVELLYLVVCCCCAVFWVFVYVCIYVRWLLDVGVLRALVIVWIVICVIAGLRVCVVVLYVVVLLRCYRCSCLCMYISLMLYYISLFDAFVGVCLLSYVYLIMWMCVRGCVIFCCVLHVFVGYMLFALL